MDEVKRILPSGWQVVRSSHLAELWAGYGDIYRIHVRHTSGTQASKIVKIIRPPVQEHAGDEGHLRKVLSYRVEANFYRTYAGLLKGAPCHVPELFASSAPDGVPQIVVMEDITVRYPVLGERRGILSTAQVKAAVDWLSTFHAAFAHVATADDAALCPPPLDAANWRGHGVWQYGGYSYLLTRKTELAAIPADSHWGQLGLHTNSPLPAAIDACLADPSDRARITLIHGDVKAANMAFSPTDTTVSMAMYDFQYVGLGLGVQDLAKFLTTSVSAATLADEEDTLLRQYHARLTASGLNYPFDQLWHDWELALVSWVRFQAGWAGGFWGDGVDWLTHRVTHLLSNPDWTQHVLHTYASKQ